MIFLGLNAFHGDASACLIRDGKIIAAAEEERFRRIKHWVGFPSEAIRYCLTEAGAKLADVEHIALNSDPKANILRRLGYAVMQRPDLKLIIDRIRNQNKRSSVESELEAAFPIDSFRGKIHRVEHHLSHLASCFLVSPFEEAIAVSIDGFGDFASAAWGIGRGNALIMEDRVWFPHSLGAFYQAMTQYLGFPHYGDESKVMGLAPYGEPRFIQEMRQIVRLRDDGAFALDLAYFRHHREKIAYEWSGGSPHVGTLFSPALEEFLGPARGKDDPLEQKHRDLARSAQDMYEEAFFHLLHKLHARHRLDSLTLAGGCAMNSVANGKVRRRTQFKRVYIQSAVGDAGGAIGAAMQVWHQIGGARGKTRAQSVSVLAGDVISGRTIMDHAFLGPGCDSEEIAALLKTRAADLAAEGCRPEHIGDEPTLCRKTADAIARGEVVGWFQGRMEWGPRALGNRSIVCDPRRADMKDILNLKIKRRESFRPFAPSILREHVAEWFGEEDDVPFMMQVFQIRAEKRALIPAVTHIDGSGRLQTVHRHTNPRYWQLIESFRELTGVPMVLNTSFNENEPVVCKPEEALNCFLRTKMNVLVLGNSLIERQD
ncbi:MAG TPA: carbamoyltransferase C-terminal domain-containing protein [Steroidobacteraceae bacterium]|nr:carbamoyltransferase C-terminal domain-containing protein [Steroidobacteraceae bacterium]